MHIFSKHKTLFLISLFLLLFVFFIHPFEGTGDFYHHVNTGRYIIQNGSLPNLDTFSHTAKNMPWVAHSWLSGFIFYLLLTFFGTMAISIFNALVAAVTLLLLYLLLRSYKIEKVPAILTIISVAIAFSTRFPQRPEIFAYPLTIGILLVDSLKAKYKKIIYLLPVLIIIWANIYGSSVLFGIGLITLLAIKEFVTNKFKLGKNEIIFYLTCLISIFASLINGYGLRTIFYFYLYIPKVSIYEGEWAGITRLINSMPEGQLLTSQYYILIYILFVVSFLITAMFAIKIWKNYIFFAILSLFIVIPFFAFRTFPLAVLLTSPFIALCLNYLFIKKKNIYLIPFVILTTASLYISIWINPPRYVSYSNPIFSDLESFVTTNKIYGNALNLGHLGGLLTYTFYPNILVFFDTRDELYINSPAIKDLYSTYNKNESIIPLLKKYKVDLVVADYMTDGMNYKNLFYSLVWAPVYLNDRYFIVIPTEVAKSKNIKILSFLDPFSQSAAKPGHEEEAKKYYTQLLSKNPDSLIDKLYLTRTLASLGEYDKVIKIAQGIEINESSLTGPSMKRDISNLLAESYIENRDCANTKKYIDTAVKPIGKLMLFKKENSNDNFIPKALPFYYLECEKDPAAAEYSLRQYLTQGVSPLEQLQLTKKFESEANK